MAWLMPLVKSRLGYALLGLVVGGILLLAMENRERPLQKDLLPDSALAQLQWSHAGNSSWKEIRYEAKRAFTSPDGRIVDSRVEYRLENLGKGLVRRSDNWYPLQAGNALVHEERYLLYANLFGLTARYREPAPVFHAIFENTGWFENRLVELEFRPPDLNTFDVQWLLQAKLAQLQDRLPATRDGKTAERVAKEIRCTPVLHAAGARTTVSCQVKSDDGLARTALYVFLNEVGIFILNEYEQVKDGESESSRSVIRNFQVDGVELKI
jgi:hypothetical protein